MGDCSYGFVASATTTSSGHKVAINKVKDAFLDVGDATRFLREMKLLHQSDGDDLGRVIRSLQELTDQHLHYLLLQVLRGLKHVNSADELHRGLKPSALRVNAHCDLALYEFGLAVDLECLVPHWYCPPELLLECAACGKPEAALPPLAAQYTTVRTAGCTISGMQAPPPSPRCPSPAPT
eukprot:CAMPEP_0173370258 /NCGR_PEP_ID=MMETSP1144-20121109/26587_1 /TAXON_ID=483371 /ORGANISM="non described non described, Strain CCMP2298" /LENGTH=179 /DNA_ID=CAMNT_0014321791 /DNA_START=53 /DNA_END=589 /DNA_ORIENTATION=+